MILQDTGGAMAENKLGGTNIDRNFQILSSIKKYVKLLEQERDFLKNQKELLNYANIELVKELQNFEEINKGINFREENIPELEGFDIYGKEIPMNGKAGGDHIIFMDFKKRFHIDHVINKARMAGREKYAKRLEKNLDRVGLYIMDVPGHQSTDSSICLAAHQLFLGLAELNLFYEGEITSEMIEVFNDRMYQTTSWSKAFTMIYGEINKDGRFRFINMAHPHPLIYSREQDKIVSIDENLLKTYPQVGISPSEISISRKRKSVFGKKEKYNPNQLQIMGSGDIMILYTDGLWEQTSIPRNAIPLDEPDSDYEYGYLLEDRLRKWKDCSAAQICDLLALDIKNFGKERGDDISYIVVKKD